ncbi:MAG: ester cyclase [Nocardioidaceae bacterium]
MADNIDFIRSLYDAWNARDFDVEAEAMAPDGRILVVGTGSAFIGPDGSRQYSTSWAEGFPDGRVTVDNIFGDQDRVVVELTGRGTHTGTLETSMGAIPATGRSMTLQLCDVVELRDGKIVEQRTYFDSASMMAQLGVSAEQLATLQQ